MNCLLFTGISKSRSLCLNSNRTHQYASNECLQRGPPSEVFLFIFILSQLTAGAGTTPLYTLGPAYIDENVNPKNTALYLGVIYGAVMLGPGLGSMIGGKLLGFYVDLKQVCEQLIQLPRSHVPFSQR